MHILFLPGSGGAPEFWHPLGTLLPSEWQKTYLSWPGLGNQPHDTSVKCIDDLVALAEKEIRGPTVVVAQSMGGVVGVRLALRNPSKITHLILCGTSGGVGIAGLGGEDWRPEFLSSFPGSARWITEEKPDHTDEIPAISCPTLLLWGSADPVSPVSVGERLLSLLPNALLHVIAGGDHDFARDMPERISELVKAHVNRRSRSMAANASPA